MCGRFVITGDPFNLGFKDKFNITPSQEVPIKTLNCDGQLKKWAFSPSWKTEMNLINCRAETMDTKPSFKQAQRCIIPFSGWYEWQKQNTYKTPYFIYSEAKYFAGLYNENGCLIITTAADKSISHIHHRQPVMLTEWNLDKWFTGNKDLDSYMHKTASFYKVSTAVNNPNNDFAGLIEEVI